MNEAYDKEAAYLNSLIKEYGGVDSYTTTQAANIFEQICKMVSLLGLNPENRTEFFDGVRKIFNIQLINYDKYKQGKYIFVPNHVSEFDGFLFGIMFANMLVVAKSEWISDPRLNNLTQKMFSIVGLHRKDSSSGIEVLRKCVDYLNGLNDGALTIFVQQTIADIEITTPEDVASGACFIARRSSSQIIPVYSEQISAEAPTRIVFGDPLKYTNRKDFGDAWMKSEFELRDSISSPKARPPVLCEKHRKPINQREFSS